MKTVLFYDSTFPYNGARPSDEVLKRLQQQFQIVNADNLESGLEDADSLVNLHGPYFPKASWSSILAYLRNGKGLVHIGGAPFRIPVYKEEGTWRQETEQTGYHQQINIHETLVVDKAPIQVLKANYDIPLFVDKEDLFTIESTYNLVFHVTKAKDLPHENGSGGPMDAHIYPLMKGVSSKNREVAAPAVLLENTKGQFSSGRWLFINQPVTEVFWKNGGMDAIGEWSRFTARGVTEIWVKPNYASYREGEQPTINLQLQTLNKSLHGNKSWNCKLEVEYSDSVVFEKVIEIRQSRDLSFEFVTIPIQVKPGYYTVTCTAVLDQNEVRVFHQGFWGFDQDLLEQGTPLTCDRDYFWKDGRPFPIVGMTYMTSDVARKYLWIPNVAAWDRDMEQMKNAGINLIRTGLWTGFRQLMFVDGHAYEEVLRAIDAFILTAKKHDIEVTFNFFSFTPETWEGVNPYLDPRSLEAQKRFISAVVSRHKKTTNVDWDLINEPSMFDPKRIFQGPQTARDKFEREAFREWVKARHKDIRVVQERWNMTPEELSDFSMIEPPEQDDINFRTTEKQPKKGSRWLDYTLFTQDMHNRWAAELTACIKAISPNQLVTVGQDEGLGAQRPSPFFYGKAVDYTTVHSWWLMDHLVWDGIFTKTPDKPNLIQETGIMYVERSDGKAKRSEEELKSILERKYAYAFATGGAGAVQWLWNTNHYMDNINESNIGAVRSDNTEKPEADVSYDFGQFFGEIRDLFVGRELEDVAAIFPYSNDFSNRKVAFGATVKLSRLFNYEFKLPFRAFGEYDLDLLAEKPPKLIIVPSAHNFSNDAFAKLILHVQEHGGTLLWTGPIGLDEYWKPVARLTDKLGETRIGNVLREELLEISGKKHSVSYLTDNGSGSVTFGGNRLSEVEKEYFITEDGKKVSSQIKTVSIGKGKLIWCPLPIELNNRDEPLKVLYELAISESNVTNPLEWKEGVDLPGIYGRKLQYQKGALYIFVSEYSEDTDVEITDRKTGVSYRFTIESDRTVMFATDENGTVTSIYRPDEVEIKSLTGSRS